MTDSCVQEDSAGVLTDWGQLTEPPLSVWSSSPPWGRCQTWWRDDVLLRVLDWCLRLFLSLEAAFRFRSRTFLIKADNHNWRTFTWLSRHPQPTHPITNWRLLDSKLNLFYFYCSSCFPEILTRFLVNIRRLLLLLPRCPPCWQGAGGCSTIAISRTGCGLH